MFAPLPMNTPVSVARGIAQACADENLNGITTMNGLMSGKPFWVMDNKLTEIEGTIESTMNLWLGERNTELFRDGAE